MSVERAVTVGIWVGTVVLLYANGHLERLSWSSFAAGGMVGWIAGVAQTSRAGSR